MKSGSHSQDEISIAVTGTAWVGGGVGSVHAAMEKMVLGAENEIQIAIFEITKASFGFLELIRKCLARGVRVSMIINRYREKRLSVREKLEGIAQKYPNLELYDFTPDNRRSDLHAKILVIDRQKALIGSANLTWNGMIGNHEMAAILSGKIAWQIGSLLDKLSSDSHTSGIVLGR